MRKLAIGLMVLALVGLAASMALAAPPHPVHAANNNIQLAAHHGPHGYHPGGYRPHVYRPWVYRPYVAPIVPAPVYPTYRYYYGYPYYYGPGGSFQYYGPGGGISVGW